MMRSYPKAMLLVLALALAAVASPTSAVILVLDAPAPGVTLQTFDSVYAPNNTEVQISNGARASALFVGQGWRNTAVGADEFQPWESPDGNPTSGTSLALLGQFPPPAPPVGSPPVNPAFPQNAASFPNDSDPTASVFGGLVNGLFYGATSVLFRENIDAFSLKLSGSGINKDDGLGGPVWFAFFDRMGTRLQCEQNSILSDVCTFPKATDIFLNFGSTQKDIAGLQVWHQDPRGLSFTNMEFIPLSAPVPATLLLTLFGLAQLGLLKRTVARSSAKNQRTGWLSVMRVGSRRPPVLRCGEAFRSLPRRWVLT